MVVSHASLLAVSPQTETQTQAGYGTEKYEWEGNLQNVVAPRGHCVKDVGERVMSLLP